MNKYKIIDQIASRFYPGLPLTQIEVSGNGSQLVVLDDEVIGMNHEKS